MPNDRELSAEELRARVIFSLLMPASRLTAAARLPLAEIKKLVELAAYQEARSRRLKMKEISKLLSVSMSKVGQLSKELKEHYAEPAEEHGIGRKILTLLWAGPMSVDKIQKALEPEAPAAISKALSELVADGRLQAEHGRTVVRYALGAPQHRLVKEPWMAKIDALDNLLSSLIQAVEARFFDNDPRAFARTLNFRVRPEDFDRLRRHYEELFKLVVELDDAGSETEDGVPVQLSIFWAENRDFPDSD